MKRRIAVIGSGLHFISGVSYFTVLLVEHLAEQAEVSVVLMRRLVPKILYPGASRVGKAITPLSTSDFAPTYDGIDWTMVPSIPLALRFLNRQRPEVLLLQWWTASSLPAFHVFTWWAKRHGLPVILEMHEDLHEAEAKVPVLGALARRFLHRLVVRADRIVAHSTYDRDRISRIHGLDPVNIAIIPVGPFRLSHEPSPASDAPIEESESTSTTVLFFGTVRPYKGLEHLIEAFDHLPRDTDRRWQLLVVGERWEGWDLPFDLIAASPNAADIEVVDRYVTDEEVPSFFARADVVALPYLVSSASGPLALTMNLGLPVVVTRVGGLEEAAERYGGAVFCEPNDPLGLALSLEEAAKLRGKRFDSPHDWGINVRAYLELVDSLADTP